MKPTTLVIVAAMIAATAAFALAPLVTSNAMALRNGGSQTTQTCVHNGNGDTTSGACTGNGNSAQTVTQTQYKCQGKFQSTPC
jgi:hypothetical protein